MEFQPLKLDHLIEITDIITIHYFEYDSEFVFPGESHDFWEFLCVDKGCVTVTAETDCLLLKKNDIIFHQPDEFHALAAKVPAPNLAVISFSSKSAAMDFFRKKQLRTDTAERDLLSSIIADAKNIFCDPLDDPRQKGMRLKTDAPASALQMIGLRLELFLLHLYHRYQDHAFPPSAVKEETAMTKGALSLLDQVDRYLLAHLSSRLSVEQIARENFISVSQLDHLIRTRYQCGVTHHFISLKIDRAKHLIRNRKLNFSQIALILGYPSIHYFSRQFKKITGMTPSEYSTSIRKNMDVLDHDV